eukprot:3598950-Prymnesium_polylepis.1
MHNHTFSCTSGITTIDYHFRFARPRVQPAYSPQPSLCDQAAGCVRPVAPNHQTRAVVQTSNKRKGHRASHTINSTNRMRRFTHAGSPHGFAKSPR